MQSIKMSGIYLRKNAIKFIKIVLKSCTGIYLFYERKQSIEFLVQGLKFGKIIQN